MKHMATTGVKSRVIKVGKRGWPIWPISYSHKDIEDKPGEVPTDTRRQMREQGYSLVGPYVRKNSEEWVKLLKKHGYEVSVVVYQLGGGSKRTDVFVRGSVSNAAYDRIADGGYQALEEWLSKHHGLTSKLREASTKVVGGVKFTSIRGRAPFGEYEPYADDKYREQFSAVVDNKTIYTVGDKFGSSRRMERLDGRGTEVVCRWSGNLDEALRVSKSKRWVWDVHKEQWTDEK